MQDSAHVMMTLDIVMNSWWTDYKVNRLRNSFQTSYGRYPDLVAKYQKSVREMLNDSFPFNRSLLIHLCCEGFVDFRDLQDLSLEMSLEYHCSSL